MQCSVVFPLAAELIGGIGPSFMFFVPSVSYPFVCTPPVHRSAICTCMHFLNTA